VNNFDKALQCLNEVLRLEPGDRQTMLSAYGVSLRANRLGQARNYLTAWLNAHPNDEEVKARLEEFDAAVKAVPVTPQPDSKEE
jgi:predicted Zn-dependent protease